MEYSIQLVSKIGQPVGSESLSRLCSQESESGHNLCSSSTLVPVPSPASKPRCVLCLSTNLNSAMSTYNTRNQKRLRETTEGVATDSESPTKRKKLTRYLQLLYDEVKEKSQLLDAQLNRLLKLLPTNESATEQKFTIEFILGFLQDIKNTGKVKRVHADVFGQDFDVAFPEAMISHLNPGG